MLRGHGGLSCECCKCWRVSSSQPWTGLCAAFGVTLIRPPLGCTDVSLMGIVITLMSSMRAEEKGAD